MDIKAAVIFEKSGDFSIEQLEMSEPLDDEVLVRTVAVGICHTDLAARNSICPFHSRVSLATKVPVSSRRSGQG